MKFLRKFHPATAAGVLLVIVGLDVMYTGMTKQIALVGGQKYLVGGVFVAGGLYCIFLGLKASKP